MSKCSWEGCEKEAVVDRTSDDGEVWARLCQEHADKMESAEPHKEFDPEKLLSNWVKAQGGAKKAAARMTR